MPRKPVPITPAVLRWAVDESGLGASGVADKAGVPLERLESWIEAIALPGPGDFSKLAAALNRPRALFFLPEPPPTAIRATDFRFPTDESRNHLAPSEFKHVRRAKRLQRVLSWAAARLDRGLVKMPTKRVSDDPTQAAQSVLRLAEARPKRRPVDATASQFQHWWRSALEDLGVVVMLVPIGERCARGFALADDHAPIIGVNTTALNYGARIFTMLHELGHIVLRTSAVSDNLGARMSRREDPVERWCEQFAAALLLPWPEVSEFMRTELDWGGSRMDDLHAARSVAVRFGASLTAAVVCLIDHGVLPQDIYKLVKKNADTKRRGGPGEGGRDRVQVRRDEYGDRAVGLVAEAVKRDLLDRREALSQLRLRDSEFDRLVG